jgi:hypothetical protein
MTGSIEAGLKSYVGAALSDEDGGLAIQIASR